MPPKTDGPPRPKKVMTPEMLEKLAAARAKANVARAAMKSDNDELKLQLLQRKMDAIKNTKVKAPKPETPEQKNVPELMTEQMPDSDEMPQSDDIHPDDISTKPEPHSDDIPMSNDTVTPPASPVKAIKKKKKKPVIIVENSDSDSDDDNSNVIYIRRKSKSKTPPQVSAPPPQAAQPPPPPIINPFFSYYHGSQRNFQ